MGGRTVPAQPASRPDPEPPAAAVCKHTGLRAGDRVRTWPYDGDPVAVRGTEVEAGAGTVWVLLADGSATASHRVRLAAYGCPVCGACEGPVDGAVVTPYALAESVPARQLVASTASLPPPTS